MSIEHSLGVVAVAIGSHSVLELAFIRSKAIIAVVHATVKSNERNKLYSNIPCVKQRRSWLVSHSIVIDRDRVVVGAVGVANGETHGRH